MFLLFIANAVYFYVGSNTSHHNISLIWSSSDCPMQIFCYVSHVISETLLTRFSRTFGKCKSTCLTVVFQHSQTCSDYPMELVELQFKTKRPLIAFGPQDVIKDYKRFSDSCVKLTPTSETIHTVLYEPTDWGLITIILNILFLFFNLFQ